MSLLIFFADVGGYALDFHHGFVIQYGCNRDIELDLLTIANRDALEEPFDSAINRSASGGGGGVAVAAVGCGIEPAAVAATESKKE
ncbi:hypothetical protein L1987_76600 [Smallanthus sonchifolius]|uniref:Uncharacterized protein n=1 Tax=Smallanthus sonchifolius TaxID=185202 RepID=A0ACB8Z6N5_9ASTR|nr:hypothetical protein L1987_76600 [Smallanthus sonchifolius]